MQNRTEPLARHASPGHDWVVTAMQAVGAVMVIVIVVLLVRIVHRDAAMANLHCPAPDHAVWADSLGPWWLKGEALCGDSLTITGHGTTRPMMPGHPR